MMIQICRRTPSPFNCCTLTDGVAVAARQSPAVDLPIPTSSCCYDITLLATYTTSFMFTTYTI